MSSKDLLWLVVTQNPETKVIRTYLIDEFYPSSVLCDREMEAMKYYGDPIIHSMLVHSNSRWDQEQRK